MKVTKCKGEGQGSCKSCSDNGKWNRTWTCFLYEIEGYEGCYCRNCVNEICNEKGGNEMPRYIDADETIELLRSLGSRDYRREKGTICDAIKMLQYPEYTPTADVVPKSEVETAKAEAERLKYDNQYLMSELLKAREQIAFMKRAEELDKIPKW